MIFGLGSNGSAADDPVMDYIIERKNRFYVVASTASTRLEWSRRTPDRAVRR